MTYTGILIDSLIDLVDQNYSRETLQHALELAYADGVLAGVTRAANPPMGERAVASGKAIRPQETLCR